MKRILLLPNFNKPLTVELMQKLCECLDAYGLTAVALSDDRSAIEGTRINTVEYIPATIESVKSCDLLMAIGGDGTIIRNAYYGALTGKPLVGINTGNFGFLSQINPEQLERDLQLIVNGNFHIEKRMALAAQWGNPSQIIDFALNDIVLTKPLGM